MRGAKHNTKKMAKETGGRHDVLRTDRKQRRVARRNGWTERRVLDNAGEELLVTTDVSMDSSDRPHSTCVQLWYTGKGLA